MNASQQLLCIEATILLLADLREKSSDEKARHDYDALRTMFDESRHSIVLSAEDDRQFELLREKLYDLLRC